MTLPPSPPPGAQGGWNPPPAGTDWPSAPAYTGSSAPGPTHPGSPPAGYPPAGYGQGAYAPLPPPPGPQKGRSRFTTGRLVTIGVSLLVAVVVAAVTYFNSATRDDSGTISKSGDVSTGALRAGDCVNDIKDSDDVSSLPAVPCAMAHEGEIFAVFDLPAGPYPGDGKSVPQSASDECTKRFDSYAPTADAANLTLSVIFPLPANWAKDDRTVDCIATSANGGRTTGSLKGK